ncbi:MAG: M42 family metallopeptidase [Chloroflexi bacterium]|nr:M42 family metallopeptidase [Chloroflexota bacterium]
MDIVGLMRTLSSATGISGYECALAESVRQAFQPFADEFSVDTLGNLIALKRATRPVAGVRRSIMLAGHMDEIGMIVKEVKDGYLRATDVGGIDFRTLLGQEVVVHGVRDLPGVIGARPPHVLAATDYEKPVPWDQFFIDIGLPADQVSELVHVGDLVSLRREFIELAEGHVSGKAFDDRAGVASLAVCLEQLSSLQHSWDVYAIATTQEETGLKGATTAAYGINPDIGIAVDVGFGAQSGVAEHESIRMNAGPAIAIGPNVHPKMQARLMAVGDLNEVPYQKEVIPGASGTDGWAIQVARAGIPTAVLSIPLRYMHTTVETLNVKDIERAGRLMALFISGLDEAFAADLGL